MFENTRYVVLEDKSRVISFLFKLSMAARFRIRPEVPLFCLFLDDSSVPRQLKLRFDRNPFDLDFISIALSLMIVFWPHVYHSIAEDLSAFSWHRICGWRSEIAHRTRLEIN
ncbi:hypothetical protein HAX54_008488 [Datura stramonium]|uniref:Uncharacterized protein n=1 Tax=Datura stramonium TaxID=4076 RepID=A0ABS8TF51_DATST|nr:hypothetical protein [Datura stramonium]